MPFKRHIVLLLTGVLLPFVLLCAVQLFWLRTFEVGKDRQTVSDLSGAVTLAIESELDRRATAVRLLAASPAIASGRLDEFQAQAATGLSEHDQWVNLIQNGQTVLDSREHGSLRGVVATAFDQKILEDAKAGFQIGNVWLDADKRLVFSVVSPVLSPWVPASSAVAITGEAAGIQKLLSERSIPEGWSAYVIDRSAHLVASWPQKTNTLRRASSEQTADVRDSASGVVHESDIGRSGWKLIIHVPQLDLALLSDRLQFGAIASLSLLVVAAFATAAYFAQNMLLPIRQLARAANALRMNERVNYAPSRIRELDEIGQTLVVASNELLASKERLEQSVADALEKQRIANEKLASAEKLEALGRLTAGVTNDVNKLLALVASNAALLRRHSAAPVVDAGTAAILRAVKTGQTLMGQLVSFSHAKTTAVQDVELTTWLPPVLQLLRSSLGEDHEMHEDVALQMGYVKVDPAELEICLLNLIINAREAMPEGGLVSVFAHSDDSEKQAMATISIRDTGLGIRPEHLGQVFDPFFTTKSAGTGRGLGLSQVYGFCKRAGGTLHIQSKQGEGTVVTLRLPSFDTTATQLQPPHGASSMTAPIRVIYVEDDADLGETMVAIFEAMGYVVDWVTSAQRALSLLQAQFYDILVCDIVIGDGMGGLELAQFVRTHRPETAILVVSGNTQEISQASVFEFEAMSKPCLPEELDAAIRRLVLMRRMGT